MVDLEAVGVRSYISEPDRGRRNWKDNPEARDAVYRNRRRIRGARANAYCANAANGWSDRLRISNETGRMRRTHLRGHDNILKRVLLHAQHAEISTGLQAWTAHVSVNRWHSVSMCRSKSAVSSF